MQKNYIFFSILGGIILTISLFCGQTYAFQDGSFLRNNDLAINQAFWDAGPSNSDIINALYGDGTGGLDTTFYTENRQENNCNTNTLQIKYIENYATSGTDMLPTNLATGTIYILKSGTHLTSTRIYGKNCTAIVGKGKPILYDTVGQTACCEGLIHFDNAGNTILENITIDGTNNGLGSSHGATYAGVRYDDSGCRDSSANNLDLYGTQRAMEIRGEHQKFTNIKAHDNTALGIRTMTSGSLFQNIETYNNTYYGFYFRPRTYTDPEPDLIYPANHNILENLKTYNNGQYGLILYETGDWNIINNIDAYNNGIAGIYVWYLPSHNTFNNINTFNNGEGMRLGGGTKNMFSNINIFNNDKGIYARGDTDTLADNITLFNNNIGLYIEDDWKDTQLHNISIYNNNMGIDFDYTRNISENAPSKENKYYGNLIMFANNTNITGIDNYISTGMIVSGTIYDGTKLLTAGTGILGRSSGLFNTRFNLNREWIIDVINENGESLLNGLPTDKRGINTIWTPTKDLIFDFGNMIPRQTRPWIYSGTEFTGSNLWRSKNMYIGQNSGTILKNPEKIATEIGSAMIIEGQETLDGGETKLNEGETYKIVLEFKNFSEENQINQILDVFGNWNIGNLEAGEYGTININIIPFTNNVIIENN